MIRRLADLAAGLVSLAVLVALVAGPPLLLARYVGWPLPGAVPGRDEIEHAIRTGIDNQVVVNTLAVIAWIAWAQIAVAVLVEAAALVRRRSAPNLRVLPGLQPAIGRLVATVALAVTALLPTATATIAVAAGPPPAAAAFHAYQTPVTVVLPATTTDPPPDTIPAPTLDTAPALAPVIVEVQRHDSLWAIAERTLGDGTRWRELRDANVGRAMPDGTTIGPTTELIHPGWTLHLPGTTPATLAPAATVVEPLAATTEQPDGDAEQPVQTTVVVEKGDNLWTIAEEHLTDTLGRSPTEAETVDYWRELIDTNRPLLVTGDPSLIYPGQTFTLPTTDSAPAPTDEAAPIDTPPTVGVETTTPVEPPPPPQETSDDLPGDDTTDPTPTPAPTDTLPAPTTGPAIPMPPPPDTLPSPAPPGPGSEAEPVDSHSTRGSPATVVAPLGVAGVGLAVGLASALHRRRRRLAHLHPDTIPATGPHPDLQRAVVADADPGTTETLTGALEQIAVALADRDTVARPRIVQHGTDHLEVLLTQPSTPAPTGWHSAADGKIWTLDTRPHAGPVEALGRPVAPLLVTLGRPDDTGQLHLDLEAELLVSLVGDHDAAHGVARAIVTELAYSPLADAINIVLVGDLGTHAATRLEHVTVVDTWDDVLPDLTAWATHSHTAHTQHRWPTSLAGRAVTDHDALSPLVVIADTIPDDPTTLTSLTALVPAAVAVVAVGEPLDAATVIDCQPDQLVIRDLGLVCEPQTLTPKTIEHIADLLDPEPDLLPLEPIVLNTSPTGHGDRPDTVDSAVNGDDPQRATATLVEPDCEVVVRCLGDIRVDHTGRRPLTGKQTAVVTYITLHQPVTIDRLEDAAWAAPTGGSRRKRLANTVSECRGIIGARHLPPASNDGRYTTAPTVTTDLDLFDRRVAHAASQAPADAAVTLRQALALVTGPVFTYRSTDRNSYAWVDVENWVAIWEPKIAAVAQHLAELCLDQHDPTGATDAATHALGIVPTHVGLTETLMRAHAANGDPTSVDAVYHAHTNALEQLDLDDVADTTLALYDHLRRTRITEDT